MSDLFGAAAVETGLQKAADWATVATGVAAVLGLIGVLVAVLSARRDRRENAAELVTGMTQLITTVGQAFIDYPEMRPYFYCNRPPADGDEARAEAIAVVLAGALDHVAAHLDNLEPGAASAWRAYFHDVKRNSPVLRAHLEKHQSWYGSSLAPQFVRAEREHANQPVTSPVRS